MNIPTLILAAIAVLMIVAVAFGLTMAVRSYLRYRGKRVITCPKRQTMPPCTSMLSTLPAKRRSANTTFVWINALIGRNARIADRNASRKLKPTRTVAWSGTWSTIGTRARPVPIARSPSMKSTGMTGNPLFLARTATPRSGAKFRRKICPPFFRISFQCAGIASSRKTTGVSILNGWWIADGNVGWVASMFARNPRRIFRRNQPAATKRALKVALGATPFKPPNPVIGHPLTLRCKHTSQRKQPTQKHPALVPLRSQ